MKKAALIIAIVALLAGFSINDANAGWHTCTVNSVGQMGDLTVIMLTDSGGTFSNAWFQPLSTKSKEMLATAMFAAANSRKVIVYLPSTEQYGTIVVLALQLQTQ